MEEINQNQQIPQPPSPPNPPTPLEQPSEQPSKNWLIKSLLIGILGGIPFGIGTGFFSMLVLGLSLSRYPSGGGLPGAIAVGLIFAMVAPIAWVVFLLMTFILGYRFSKGWLLGPKLRVLIELVFLIPGIGWGWWIIFIVAVGGLFDYLISIFRISQDPTGLLLRYGSTIFLISSAFSSTFGAWFFFQAGRIYTKSTNFKSFVRQPLTLISCAFFLIIAGGFLLLVFKNKQIAQEINNLRFTNLRGDIILDNDGSYKIKITVLLNNPSVKNEYGIQIQVNLDAQQEQCPSNFELVNKQIPKGATEIDLEFKQLFKEGNTAFGNQTCSYRLIYQFFSAGGKQWSGEIIETINMSWNGFTSGSSFIQDNLPESAQRLVNMAKDDLVQKLGIKSEDIKFVAALEKDWPDAYLGCPQGEIVNQIATSGWQLLFEVGGKIYDYRTDQIGVKQCLKTSGQAIISCTKDSDCPLGLVCVGRGSTNPSVENPGFCLTEKQAQGVQ